MLLLWILGNEQYPFITITLSSTPNQIACIIYDSNSYLIFFVVGGYFDI